MLPALRLRRRLLLLRRLLPTLRRLGYLPLGGPPPLRRRLARGGALLLRRRPAGGGGIPPCGVTVVMGGLPAWYSEMIAMEAMQLRAAAEEQQGKIAYLKANAGALLVKASLLGIVLVIYAGVPEVVSWSRYVAKKDRRL